MSYFVLTNSLRIRSQVKTLGSQLGMPNAVQAYDLMAEKSQYGYLFIDVTPTTMNFLRFQTNLAANLKQLNGQQQMDGAESEELRLVFA